MTQVTGGEIARVYLEIVILAILGVFLGFYAMNPIQAAPMGNEIEGITSSDVSMSSASWLDSLFGIDETVGSWLPGGTVEIVAISSIILIPLTVMNMLTLFRLAKDSATQWI